ncbi:MAG: 4-hydroxy-tetrahydrodipicolinate synthase, partial [Myxococcales bacterium]
VDLEALRALVRFQLDNGVHGLVPLGSTGEAATLTLAEREAVVNAVRDEARGRAPIVVGASTNDTRTTIELVRQAKDLGADAAMIVMPYYNKPTPDGIVAHFAAISEAVDMPLVAYNVPSRTGVNLAPATAARLAAMPKVVGLKEAAGDMAQAMEIARRTQGQWSLLSGEDALLFPFLAIGGQGLISVTSNLLPSKMARIYDLWQAGDLAGSRQQQLELLPAIQAMFSSTNPLPVKAALSLRGLIRNEARLPLLALSGPTLDALRAELTRLEAI